MGHKNRGNTGLSLNSADLLTGLQPQTGIQVGKGLIQQKHPGHFHQRSGYGHPLLLTARKLPGPAVHQLLDLHQPGCFQRLFQHLRLGELILSLQIFQGKQNILAYRQVRVQGIVLKYQTNPPLLRRKKRHVILPEKNPALRGLLQTADQIQSRAFSASGRPQQADQLSVRDLKIKMIHRRYLRRVLSAPPGKFLCQIL